MAEQKKVVKGGLRATLALLISIVALIIAFAAYQRTGGVEELNSQINDLQSSMTNIKKETSKTLNKVRKETAETLKKISGKIKQE